MPRFIVLSLCLAFGSVCPAASPPNIVFIFADDQRADTIAALGNPAIQTPQLDRLVQRGLSFTHAYMQGGNNGATCVPSRAMLLSARPYFHADEKLLRDETWPRAFGQAGYATMATGKWHNGAASVGRSFQTAKSLYLGGMTNPLKAQISDLLPTGKMSPARLSPKHLCAEAADEAIAFIQAQAGKRPFYVHLAFDGPHDPHVVPADFPVIYDPSKIPLPANFLPQHPFNNGEMTVRDEQLLPWPRSPAAIQAMLADYYRYITYLDEQIGRVLAAVDASPAAANTLIVFAADSGVARGSHGLIGKQNLYEHSVRVPLIIAGPGVPKNQRTDALCYLFDVLPTLGKVCQTPGPATSEGREFSALFGNPALPHRAQLFFGYRQVQRALSDGRWKLLRYPQIDRTQLFDLQADPQELTDLSALPAHAMRVADMLTRLAAEQAAVGDSLPLTAVKVSTGEWSPPKKLPKPGEVGY